MAKYGKFNSVKDYLINRIKQEILSGEFHGSQTLPAERNLCKIFEVGRGTVRRALLDLEQQGIITSTQGSGWKIISQPLGSNTGTIAICSLLQEYGLTVYKAANSYLRKQGLNSVFIPMANHETICDHLSPAIVSGALIIGGCEPPPLLQQELQAHNIPFVCALYTKQCDTYDTISTDHFKAAEMAVNHLINKGAKTILYFGYDPPEDPSFFSKKAGYKEAMQKHNLQDIYLNHKVVYWSSPEAEANITEKLRQLPTKPDAIICSCMASGKVIYEFTTRHNTIIPETTRLAIMGNPITSYAPEISALPRIDMPLTEIGQVSAQKLLDRLNGSPLPHTLTLLAPQLIPS